MESETINPKTQSPHSTPGPKFLDEVAQAAARAARRAAVRWTPDLGTKLTVEVVLEMDFVERVRAGEKIL